VSEPLSSAVNINSSREELPLFFAGPGGALYGVFHPAEAGTGGNRVLVLCHSLGIEHMVTQRMEVLGARAAAKAGFAAFRFHSRAHGDSSGDSRDTTFTDLVDDACTAADYARERSGASRVIWVGLRFGCLVAAAALARRDDAAALALWEPLYQGDEYFRAATRAMLFCQLAQGKRSVATLDDLLKRLETEGTLAVVGTYLYSPLIRTAHDADLGKSLQHWNGDTLIAQVQRRPALSVSNQRMRSELEQRGGTVMVTLINQEPAWNMLPLVRPQWTSEALLNTTTEWLHGLE
jgi:alpha/beta superfamily hydrolase